MKSCGPDRLKQNSFLTLCTIEPPINEKLEKQSDKQKLPLPSKQYDAIGDFVSLSL